MVYFTYEDLLAEGYSAAQINQLEIASKYCDETILLTYIEKDTDIELLRKFNYLFKNEQSVEEEKMLALNLIHQDIDFEPIVDKSLSLDKKKFISSILLSSYTDKNKLIDVVKQDNVDNYIIIHLLSYDLKDNIDSSLYLYPEFSESQIFLARTAFDEGRFDIINVIKNINPEYDDYSVIKVAVDNKIDIAYLSNNKPLEDLDRIVNWKINGHNMEYYIDDDTSNNIKTIIDILISHNYSDSEIKKFLEDFSDLEYCNCHDIDNYIKLYEAGFNIKPFIEKEVPVKYAAYVLKLMDYVDKDDQEKLLEYPNFRYYELEFMYNCITYDRCELLPIIINCEYPSKDAYNKMTSILVKDHHMGQKTNIAKLFYDKGNDVFGENNKIYEFDSNQKNFLASLVVREIVNEEQLDMIRDNKIPFGVLEVLGEMISKNIDITPFLKDAPNMKYDDIVAIYRCIKMGYTIQKDDEIIR